MIGIGLLDRGAGKATVFLAFATVVLMVFTGLNLLILKGQGRDLEKHGA